MTNKQLAKQLRDIGNSLFDRTNDPNFKLLLDEASDRLENQSKWISVEDRLPDSGVHCLISCTVKRIGGTLGHYVCVGYYAERFKHLAYGVEDDCVSEYNEENDEFYIAEGWYEVIKNWDDYGFVAINDYVTHWMPLPEAPKMKGGEADA